METLARSANRGSVSTGGYDIDNSLKLETLLTEYLYFDGSSVTDYERTTFSIWIKRTELGKVHYIAEFGNGTANTTNLRILFQTDDTLNILGNSITYRVTNRKFRDTSAWYHLFFKFDTTQGTSNDRVRLWVNGVQETSFSTINNPGAGTSMGFNRNLRNTLGAGSEDGPRGFFAGYIAQAWNSGGTPPDVTDFGEFDTDTGIWKPVDISGLSIPDSNGFYLDFYNSADLGNDSSSNNNDFTLNNITSIDQATDTPTNNFCTLTSVANFYWEPKTENAVNGGTSVADSNVTNNWTGTMATTPLFTGKWYWEVRMNQPSEQMCGIHDFTGNVGSTSSTPHPYQIGRSWVVYGGGAYWIKSIDGTSTNGGTEGAFSNGTIVGVALDLDNHLLTFYENGGSAGTNLTNIDISSVTNVYSGPWMPFVGVFRNSLKTNFGGFSGFTVSSGNTDENGYGNFEYAPPSGFLAICSKNLAGS